MLPHALTQKWKKEKVKTPKKSFSFPLKKTPLQGLEGQSKKKIRRSSTFHEVFATQDVRFDDEVLKLSSQYKLDPQGIKKAMDGLINFVTTNPKLKSKLFGDEQFPIFLQLNGIKVQKGCSRIARISLKHSMYTTDSDICLIVSEVKGIPNKEHEEHLAHYEKLLAEKGVDNIKKIMTFHEFRTEYETYELKNRLVELYDLFLVDAKLSGKTVKKCGKIFYTKRKIPTPVKLHVSKLREHICRTLRKSPLYLHSKGDSFRVQIGHSKMNSTDLVENVVYAVNGLDSVFPGGFGNIRSLSLITPNNRITIPIYVTLKSKNDVIVPKVKKEHVEVVTGELTTKLNSYVKVKSTGDVTVVKISSNVNGINTSKIGAKPDKLKKVKRSNDNTLKIGESKKQKLSEDGTKKQKHKNK